MYTRIRPQKPSYFAGRGRIGRKLGSLDPSIVDRIAAGLNEIIGE
jgi:hypothetical protein